MDKDVLVVRRSLIPALVLLILALGASDAYADPFTISYDPSSPVAGQMVTFTAHREKGNTDGSNLVWNFGDETPTATGGVATHEYATAGTYTVTLEAPNADGTTDLQDSVTITVAPKPNSAPSAAFSVDPASPFVNEPATFTAAGTDPDGDSVTWSWDFGDGTSGTGAAPVHAYATAADYIVALTATDEHGMSASSFQSLTVQPLTTDPPPTDPPPTDPPPTDPPPTDPAPPTEPLPPGAGVVGGSEPIFPTTPAPTAPAPMRPFPVVRIAGVVLPRGALVRILSVRGPRGMQVRVRCRGRGCPVASMSLRSATRLARLHRFERRLAAGTRLEVFVRKPGKIGKYTRFLIRAGEAPTRVDRCLVPGRARPVRCQ